MHFEPWVGNKYREEGLAGVRVLVLGESHYADPGLDRPSFTVEVVRECVYGGRAAFFTKVAKLVTGGRAGMHLPNEALRDTWDRIAFSNYVQEMLPAARVPPTPGMWQRAREAFPAVLEALQPQVILALGQGLRAWLEVPDRVEVCFSEHPSSSRFTYEPWAERFRATIDRVRSGTAP